MTEARARKSHAWRTGSGRGSTTSNPTILRRCARRRRRRSPFASRAHPARACRRGHDRRVEGIEIDGQVDHPGSRSIARSIQVVLLLKDPMGEEHAVEVLDVLAAIDHRIPTCTISATSRAGPSAGVVEGRPLVGLPGVPWRRSARRRSARRDRRIATAAKNAPIETECSPPITTGTRPRAICSTRASTRSASVSGPPSWTMAGSMAMPAMRLEAGRQVEEPTCALASSRAAGPRSAPFLRCSSVIGTGITANDTSAVSGGTPRNGGSPSRRPTVRSGSP